VLCIWAMIYFQPTLFCFNRSCPRPYARAVP
jgi:hypothetical protein